MYEYLKALFKGENEGDPPVALTFEQFSERLQAAKGIKLANLSEGGYVAKEKFDAKETELAGVRQQLTDANTQIQSYKDMDIDGIKKAAADWETKYNTDTKALNDKLAAQEYAHQTDRFFAGYHFRDEFAEAGARAMFAKQGFKLENGVLVGAEAWMKAQMEDERFKSAFVSDNPPPADPPADPEPKKPPKFSAPGAYPPPRTRPSLSELMKQKNENPNAVIKYE